MMYKDRSILFILILFHVCSFGQSILKKKEIKSLDSLYLVATDTTKPINTRVKAYKIRAWKTIFKEYELGLQYSNAYLEFVEQKELYNEIPRACHYKGQSELMLGKYDEADLTYRKGLEAAVYNKDNRWIADLYLDIGNVNVAIGKTKIAIDFYNKALNLSQENKNYRVEARAKINLGELYKKQGNYLLSLQTFQEALKHCIEKNQGGYKSTIHYNLGDLNVNVEEYESAEKHYQLALQFANDFNNTNRKVLALEKLGTLQQKLGNSDKALEYWSKALQFTEDQKIPSLIGLLQKDIALNSLNQKDYANALSHIENAIMTYENASIKEGLEEIYIIAAKTNNALGKLKASQEYFQKSYNLSLKTSNLNTLSESSLGLASHYEKTNNDKLSNIFYKNFIKYDSLKRDEDAITEIIKMEINSNYRERFVTDSLKKINEIQLLKYNYDSKEDKLKAESKIVYVALISVLIILFLLAYFLNEKRKTTNLLKEKNLIISQSLESKEVLLKEVHHRVKNNFQIITSLLNLQFKNSKDIKAKQLAVDIKSRLKAMSLIHQRLYQNEVGLIDFEDYLKHLVKELSLANKTSENIDTIINVKNIHLDIDTAIPLGLILNELVTNSYKYAFKTNHNNTITIQIKNIKEGTYSLEYADNGIGLDANFNIKELKSLGLKLVYRLVRQLQGELKITSNQGATFHILFKDTKTRKKIE
jgi:two-component sensor histidine kinase